MKKFLVSTLVISGLTLTGVGTYALEDQPTGAETEQQMEQPANPETNLTEVKGEVLSVEGTNVEVKDEAGMTHSFDTTGIENADEFKTEPLQAGEMIKVQIDGGKATSIERIDTEDKASSEEPAMGEDEKAAEDPAAGQEDLAAEDPAASEDELSADQEAVNQEEVTEQAAREHPQDAESMKQDLEGEDSAAEAPETGTTDEAATGTESGEETAAEGEYIVKDGDTLATIAEQELGSQDKWGLIAKANNLENPDSIYVGQRLEIPSDTEFESGEFEQNQEFAPEESGENEPAMDDSGKPAGSY